MEISAKSMYSYKIRYYIESERYTEAVHLATWNVLSETRKDCSRADWQKKLSIFQFYCIAYRHKAEFKPRKYAPIESIKQGTSAHYPHFDIVLTLNASWQLSTAYFMCSIVLNLNEGPKMEHFSNWKRVHFDVMPVTVFKVLATLVTIYVIYYLIRKCFKVNSSTGDW